MPQRSATVAQCAVVCSPCPSDDEDSAPCPQPSTRLCAQGLLREEQGESPIVDCGQSKRIVCSSVVCGAVAGDGLSRIEVDSSGLVHGESPGPHYVCADVADCFHRMCFAGEIRHFFSWPGLADVLFAAD